MAVFEKGQALLIGVADYENISPLPSVITNDVEGIFQLLIDPSRCGYSFRNVQTLVDNQATKRAILEAFHALAQRCEPDSTALVYFSGHGGSIETGECAGQYLAPFDTDVNNAGLIPSTAISHEEFTDCLDAIPAKRVAVFFDCCHAGGIGTVKNGARFNLKGLSDDYYELLSEGKGRAIFASSQADETSLILDGANNSLFTEALLLGLKGGAAYRPKKGVRILELSSYIQDYIADKSSKQHPVFKCSAGNFTISLHQDVEEPPPVAVPAKRQPQVGLKLQTRSGSVDRIQVAVKRLENVPSIEERVLEKKEAILPPPINPLINPLLQSSVMAIQGMGPTREEIFKYLEGPFTRYLEEYDLYLNQKHRLVRLNFVLTNAGNLPATNAQIVVDVSNLGTFLDYDEIPTRPTIPAQPKGALFDSRLDALSLYSRPFPYTPMVSQRSETATYKLTDTEAEWHIARLQHGRDKLLNPLDLLISLPGSDTSPVEVPFTIYSNEFEQAVCGKIICDIDVALLDWSDADQNDRQEREAEEEADD